MLRHICDYCYAHQYTGQERFHSAQFMLPLSALQSTRLTQHLSDQDLDLDDIWTAFCVHPSNINEHWDQTLGKSFAVKRCMQISLLQRQGLAKYLVPMFIDSVGIHNSRPDTSKVKILVTLLGQPRMQVRLA